MQKLITISFLCLFLASSVKAQFYRIDTLPSKDKTVYIHLLDPFRFGSPAIKLSFEKKRYDQLFELEASIISDLNGRYNVLYDNEKGIFGGQIALIASSIQRESNSYRSILGARLNYSHKRRFREEWVSIRQGGYFQEMAYTQINNNIGIYLRYAHSWYDNESIRFTMAFNPGYLFQFVSNTLPEGIQNPDDNFFFTSPIFTNVKDPGFYHYFHFYIELNFGYTF